MVALSHRTVGVNRRIVLAFQNEVQQISGFSFWHYLRGLLKIGKAIGKLENLPHKQA